MIVCWCLSAIPAQAFDKLEPIQACPLTRLPKPVPAPAGICSPGHCVAVDERHSVCKCLVEDGEENARLILTEGGRSIQSWPARSYANSTDDFDVLAGDVRGNGREAWIVANHEFSTQGLLVDIWDLHALDPAKPERSPVTWTVSDYGASSFAKPVDPQHKGCDLLVTEWRGGRSPDGKAGLYFVGDWFRLGAEGVEPLRSRPQRLRRLPPFFQRERAADRAEPEVAGPSRFMGRPGQWLRPGKALPPASDVRLDSREGSG